MTSKIVSLFDKQPLETGNNQSEIDEVINGITEVKDNINEILIIAITKDDEMILRSGNMSRESAYFVLGLAQLNALTGE
jgi:hypothetical protein